MKKFIAVCLAFVTLPVFAMTADDIMAQVDQVEDAPTVKSDMTMVLVDQKGKQRVRSMQSVSAEYEEIDKSLMFFLEPTDVKGTGFLMFDYEAAETDDDQWMFLPALNKAKRIANSDKTGSFMGSDFSYSDMSKRNLEEWTYEIVKEDAVNGVPVWLIESTPVDDKVIEKTGYVRSIVYVRQDNFRVIRAINYLEKKGEVKLMNVAAHEVINGYWVNTQIQMLTQKNGNVIHRTLMKLSNVEVGIDVDDSDFTLNRLEQGL